MSEAEKMAAKFEADGLRKLAFVGVALSTVATLMAVVSVPMVYNYAQQLHSHMGNELEFCRSRGNNIWREIARTQVSYIITILFLYFTTSYYFYILLLH